MLLTGPNRLDLSLSLARRFEERRIRIRKDALTRADLLAIKRMGSEESGSVRIVNDGDVHADEFWAYALASRAGDQPPALYEYQSSRMLSAGHDPRREDGLRFSRGSRFGEGAY